jgi:hypothetical protein
VTIEESKNRSEEQIFSDLALVCGSPGYIHAIAFLCLRDNSVLYKETLTADDLSQNYSRSRLIRTEIATLLGLMTRHAVDVVYPSVKKVEEYIVRTEALLEELHQAIALNGFSPQNWMDAAISGANPFAKGSALREPIFYGGESAYSFQYTALAPLKYASDADWIANHRSFTMEEASHIAESLSSLLGQKQISHIKGLREIPPEHWTMLPGFSFTAAELAEKSGTKLATVEAVLKAFTFPSTLRNSAFSSVTEFNLTNALPILEINQGCYALFQFYSLAESLYESPFFWMCGDRSYADLALTHRGSFTESFSGDCLARIFGRGRVLKNIHLWRGKDEIGEIDALVTFGHSAIVLQAKSKRLTQEARKGNDGHIKEDFKKAVQASYDQAYASAEALLNKSIRLTDSSGKTISLSEIPKIIYPICAVSDHYPALAFQARQFLQIKGSSTIAHPLVIDVFALDTMTEMLQSPLYFLSYLHRRNRFGDRIMAMHEHTLLSCHIKYNLWVEDQVSMVTFEDDISVHLDAAMAVRRMGIPGERDPAGILTKLKDTPLGDLISQIETDENEVPIELGLMLLEINEESIDFLNKYLKEITAKTKTDRKKHDVTIGFGAGSAGLTVHTSYEDIDQAREKLAYHCMVRKYSQKANRWFGVLLNPDNGKIRLGLQMEGPWQFDQTLETAMGRFKGVALRPTENGLKKVGRNDPCTCGSGKKFKKCCGASE